MMIARAPYLGYPVHFKLTEHAMQINSTQAAGLLAFVPAAVASAMAFSTATGRRSHDRGAWATIAAIYSVLAIEVLAKARHSINREIGARLRDAGVYTERRPVQAALLLAIVVLAAIITRYLARSAPTSCTSVARSTTAALVALFMVESVSLHAIDGILYHPAGPMLLIGWLWLACGWSTAVAAWSFRS